MQTLLNYQLNIHQVVTIFRCQWTTGNYTSSLTTPVQRNCHEIQVPCTPLNGVTYLVATPVVFIKKRPLLNNTVTSKIVKISINLKLSIVSFY